MNELPGELWRDVPGFAGYYQASSLGRVRSLDRTVPHPRRPAGQFMKGRILSQSISFNRNIKTGEPTVDLRVLFNLDSKQYYFNTRRVIYSTFIDSSLDYKTDGLYIINSDGNGYNNCVDNLCVATKSEKQKRVFTRGRHDSHLKFADRSKWTKPHGGTLTRKPVKQILNGELVKCYDSISQASAQTGFGQKEIIMVLKKRWNHYHGFQWEYTT